MCGITGIIGINGFKIKSPHNIIKMMQAQSHRGPDDSGIRIYDLNCQKSQEVHEAFSDYKVDGILGFNRLSIRDTSLMGHQPMTNSNENVILSYNGEIYNGNEIKQLLIKKGISLFSNTDTELVLKLYLTEGFDKCIRLLDGMFAFTLLDLRKNIIYFARDRFGIKPLYYLKQQNSIIYASEIKSLLQYNGWTPTYNKNALCEYMLYRCIYENTLFSDVKQVKPGEYIKISLSFNTQMQHIQYFNINLVHRKRLGNYSCSKKTLFHLLQKSVKNQMISDVKVGCQLSGGIDSSLITLIASKNVKLNDSVSIIFNDKKYSEEQYIQSVSKKTKVNTHKFYFCEEHFKKYFEKTIWHLETILVHPNALGLMHLTASSREYVTVLLSGEGADEVFGGYKQFEEAKKRKLFSINFENYVVSYPNIISDTIIKKAIFANNLDDIRLKRKVLFRSFKGNLFDKQIKYEMSTYLPELLIRQDKMSMANSIENRVPFLDNKLVEFALTIPERYLIKFRFLDKKLNCKPEGKFILKDIASHSMGNDFAFRNKMGFSMPIKKYLDTEWFCNYFENIVMPGMIKRKIVNTDYLQTLYKKIKVLDTGELECLWRLICFEIWCQLFLDRRPYQEILD